MSKLRILLADDHKMIREGIRLADVRRMLVLIENRAAGAQSLGTLARAIGRREDYLGAVFRTHMGIGVRAYIARCRIERAAEAIQRGEKVEAVALEVGYRSKKNFYRQFRRRFGMTPGTYRRLAPHGVPLNPPRAVASGHGG